MYKGNSHHFQEQHTKEIDLKRYFTLIKKRFWIIIVLTAISTLTGYFFSTNNNTPMYETSTRMILGHGEEDMNTLMVMIKDPIIMEGVNEQLQLERSTDSITNQITVSQVEESQVVQISVSDADPEIAAAIANVTATIYKTEIKNILGFTEVQLLSEARPNPAPLNQTSDNLTLITFVFGIIMSLGFIFLLDSLDGKIRRESEVEALLGVPVLGSISNMNKRKVKRKKKIPDVQLTEGEKAGVKQNA